MTDAIGPGDWVETTAPSTTGLFQMGRPYLVEGVTADEHGCVACTERHAGLKIRGIPSSHPTEAWPVCQFRPVYRPRSETIEALKQTAPQRELEDA